MTKNFKNQRVDLLDQLILQNDQNLIGVIDLVNTKHLFFIDFTNIDNEDLILCAINWCSNRPEKRFSVFMQQNFIGYVDLPQTKLIHFNDIKETNFDLNQLSIKNN